jgi:hypothetical protein
LTEPTRITEARALVKAYESAMFELAQLVLALSVIHGTFRDLCAPKGYVPPFRVIVAPLMACATGSVVLFHWDPLLWSVNAKANNGCQAVPR